MMATVSVGWVGCELRPAWACMVYLYTDSTRTLSLDGHYLNFGFEILTSEEKDQPIVLAERLDDRLVACRRKATILVGHDLAPDLGRLSTFAAERRLPGVDTVRQEWTDRVIKSRGVAKMFDTAHDLGLLAVAELAVACEHADLKIATATDTDGSNPTETLRQAITRTLAIALVAARATGKYSWTTSIDVDQLVTDAAWDHLAQLDAPPGAPEPALVRRLQDSERPPPDVDRNRA